MPFVSRRRSRFIRRGGRKRATHWIQAITSATLDPLLPSLIQIPSDGSIGMNWIIPPDDVRAFYDDPTIVRMLIKISWLVINGTDAAVIGRTLTAGFGIREAQGTGGTGVSTPNAVGAIEDPYIDWMFNDVAMLGNNVPAGTPNPASWTAYASTTGDSRFDIRTKRKLRDGYGLCAYDQVINDTGVTTVLQFGLVARILLLD